MTVVGLTNEQLIELLANSPTRIASLAANLTPLQLGTPPSVGEWSANDILAHLRSCDDVWGAYIRTIVHEKSPKISAVSPRRWSRLADYREMDFGKSSRAFAQQREVLLVFLRALETVHWQRTATVTGAGRGEVYSARDYVVRLTAHEQAHIRQLQTIVEGLTRN